MLFQIVLVFQASTHHKQRLIVLCSMTDGSLPSKITLASVQQNYTDGVLLLFALIPLPWFSNVLLKEKRVRINWQERRQNTLALCGHSKVEVFLSDLSLGECVPAFTLC